MGVVLLRRFGLAVAWGVVFCEVCNHCRCGCELRVVVVVSRLRMVMIVCGWWCVLKGVVYGCVIGKM